MKTSKYIQTKYIWTYILFSLLLFIVLLTTVMISLPTTTYAAEPIVLTVTPLDSDLSITDIQKPDANNYIKFAFTLSRSLAVGEVVKVYYHTEDGSAVAESGDYEKLELGSYTSFSSTDITTATLLIKVNPTLFGLDFLDKSQEDITTRRFNLLIDQVEGATLAANTPQKVVCQTAYQYVYQVKTIADVNVLKDYLSFASTIEIEETPKVDNDLPYQSDFDLLDGKKEQEIQLKYRDTGLASLFASCTFEDINEGFWNLQDITFFLNTKEKSNILMKVNADGAFFTTTNTMGMAEIYVMCVNHKNPNVFSNYVEQILGYSSPSIDADISSCAFSGDYVVTRPYGENLNYVFFRIPDKENMNVYIKVTNDSSARDRSVEGIKVYSQIIDNKTPEITDFYVDSSSFKQNDKLRVICRFNEPVQIADTSKVALSALFGTAKTEVEFEYKEGNLTDTLCFETDMSLWNLTGSYTYMQLDRIKGANLITDLAYIGTSAESGNQNALSEESSFYFNKILRGFNIDYRSPSLEESSIKCINATSSQTVNRRDFILTVKDFSAGRIYYTFNDQVTIDTNDNTNYDYSAEVTSYLSSGEDYKFNFSASGLYGEYYVHVKVVSSKTGAYDCYTYGVFSGGILTRGYYFDSEKPLITASTVTRQGLDYNVINLTTEAGSNVYDSPIETVFLSVAEDIYGLNAKSYCLYASNGSTYKTTALSVNTARNEDAFTITLSGEDTMFGLGGEVTSGQYYLSFYVIDAAGNMSYLTDYQSYRFDLSASFTSSATFSGSKTIYDDITIYDLSQTSCIITLTRTDSYGTFALYSITRGEDIIYKYSDLDGDNDWKKAISEYLDVQSATADEIVLKVKKSGYYEIIPSIISGDSLQTSANLHTIYCTNNYNDETENYLATQNGIVLKNRVFMLGNGYSYLNQDVGVKTENYNNCSYPAIFSGENVAREYVKYMEYQDLYLVQITSQQADLLNNYGSTVFVKADNEDTYAKENQYWIRYKRDTWMVNSSYSEWAYYYYKDETSAGIDIGYINSNLPLLKKAINTVTEYILALGSYVDLVGEEYLNEDNVAYLHAGQSHVDFESTQLTKLGQYFYPVISFVGDDSLCSDTVIVDNQSLPLASNLVLQVNGYTRIYFKVKGQPDSAYTLLKAKGGQTLKSAMETTTGSRETAIYTIYEINGYGVGTYDVYVDNQAPVLKVNYSQNNSEAATKFTSETTEFNCISCTLKGFESEVDEMSYVAISKSKNKIGSVYYATDLAEGITLNTGVYYLEIGDRSGNVYNVTLKLNTTPMKWDVVEVDNGIKVTCTREEEEILRYEVKCNGAMVSNTYSQSKVYTSSGTYSVYIRDIYGNVATKTIQYSRAIPSIPFSYSDTVDGNYVNVTDDCPYVKITATDNGNVYYVVSSKYLAFRVDDELNFSIKGLTENVDYYLSQGLNLGKTSVKLITKKSWTLVVSYAGYPDVTATYICSAENEAPKFEATYRANEFSIVDGENGTTLQDGTYIPSSLAIRVGEKEERLLSSGAGVYSNYIKVKVYDNSELREVVVKLNGNILSADKLEKVESDRGETYIFRAKGDYSLVATDIYGNKSSFSFGNGEDGYLAYTIDGKQIEKNVGNTYGNHNTTLTMAKDGDVLLRLTDKDGKVYFYYYNVKFGYLGEEKSAVITEYKYVERKVYKKIAVEGEEQTSTTDYYSVIEVVSSNKNTDFVVNNQHFALTINYDKSKNILFEIVAKESILTVESRVTDNSDDEPYYNYTVLSEEISDITVICDGEEIIKENNSVVRVKEEFEIAAAGLQSPVSKVEIAFSQEKLSGNINYNIYYQSGEIKTFDTAKEGFYYLKVTNIYGNTKTYTLNVSSTFTTNISAVFGDGSTQIYTDGYTNEIYSNESIAIKAYSENIVFTVNGNVVASVNDKDEFILTLRTIGDYTVKITNEFGIEKIRKVHISKAEITFSEEILTGYNEGADYTNGYTRNPLSIVENEVSSKGIKYISYYFDGKETILYDDIAEEKITLSQTINRIGERGKGEYKVVVKDIYGNGVSKIISYQPDPLLVITRTTRLDATPTVISLAYALETGVWSNNKVTITTEAKHSVLTVDNKVADCPKILELNSSNGDARFNYSIAYTDEYGYSCTFTVHLLRQTITVTPDESLILVTSDTKVITKDDIKMTFSEDATCYYQLDKGEKIPYTKGMTLRKDGTYYFSAEDKSGNTANYTIIRDTFCDFDMLEEEGGKKVLNGGIATTDVTFTPSNNDTAYIDTIVLNGVEISSESKVFAKNGKYEILVKDLVGNVKYFSFYLLLNAVSEFSYQVPYNYVVTELWYDGTISGNDGARINKMDIVSTDYTEFKVTEDGVYSVVIKSLSTGDVENFSFNIDNTPPAATLNGCKENELTTNTVKLNGLAYGDNVKVYRNGELYLQGTIGEDFDSPEITKGGDYKIVVTNKAGVSKEMTFQKKTIVNAAGSIFIIIAISTLIIGLFIGLLLRKRTRVDK